MPSDHQTSSHAATATARALIRLGVLGLSNVGAIVEVDTFYDTLGISSDADNREIRAAFRKLAKLSHPDFNAGDEEAERQFKKIDRAYKVLRDSAKRAAYDLQLDRLRSILERERSDPEPEQRNRQGSGGVAATRHFWREAARIAASALVLTVCFVALALAWGQMSSKSRPQGGAVPSAPDDGGVPADRAAAPPPSVAAKALSSHRGADALMDTSTSKKSASGPSLPPSSSRAGETRLADAAPIVRPEQAPVAPKQPALEWLSLGAPAATGERPDDSQEERTEVSRPKSGLPDDGSQRPAEPGTIQPSKQAGPVSDETDRAVALIPKLPADVPPAPPVDVPSAKPPADAPSSGATPEDLAQAVRLVGQGERYRADGNIAVAREYFARAADLGLPIAALRMAETLDPHELLNGNRNLYGPKPDLAEARKWYERAKALGAHEAEARLRRLDGH